MTRWLMAFVLGGPLMVGGASTQEPGTATDKFALAASARSKALGLPAPDEGPKPVKITRPNYPRPAFEACTEGTVTLMITIDAAGRVTDAEVLDSRPALDQAALKCVKDWRFRPARKAGVAVGNVALAPVSFKIYEQEKHEGCRKLRAVERSTKSRNHAP